MNEFLAEVRRALSGARKRELPPRPPLPESASFSARLALFRTALKRERGRLVEVDSHAESERAIAGLSNGKIVRFDAERYADSIRDAEVGVDSADALIAETGTVVRTYPSAEASRISLLPATSVFLATPDRLFGTLSEALAFVAATHRAGSAYTLLITGPSRTADIEKQLVIPAHGPRELVVVLLRGSNDRYTRSRGGS